MKRRTNAGRFLSNVGAVKARKGNSKRQRRRPPMLAAFLAALIVLYVTIIYRGNSDVGEALISDYFDEKSFNHQTTSELVKPMIEARYVGLPSPPWPQLDHRVSKAIVEGEMIGFDPSKPVNNTYSNTIVTAYYEFTSKHSSSDYDKWFQRLLKASEPMIIFVAPKSKWFDFVKERRTHAPTIVAQLPFEDSVMSTTFSKEFWEFMFSIDTEAKVHKGSNVYKIWNEKLVSDFRCLCMRFHIG